MIEVKVRPECGARGCSWPSCEASNIVPVGCPRLVSAQHDPVHKPKHYTDHPSGIECIQITEHMGFNLGNAVKYIWRCDLKRDAIEDLEKAVWYLNREIDKRRATKEK